MRVQIDRCRPVNLGTIARSRANALLSSPAQQEPINLFTLSPLLHPAFYALLETTALLDQHSRLHVPLAVSVLLQA